MTKEEQLHKLTNEYLSAFLGFSIKKLGSINESEELSQEIAYQCIVAINKGNITDNFNSYLWSIAHNTLRNGANKNVGWIMRMLSTYSLI